MGGRYLTLKKAAEYLGASTKTAQRMIARGELHWRQTPGGLRRIDREEIDSIFRPVEIPDRNRGIVTPEEERLYVRKR